MSELLTIADYEEAFRDHQRLVREIDVIINGEAGAAPQASLCDLVGQIKALVERKPKMVCGACGEPWRDGLECGQKNNGHPFPTCYPYAYS